MPKARLIGLGLGRFKSYEAAADLHLAPLTVLIGRNNSGKSSWIQALLLLRQTLKQRRPEVALSLEGEVEALSLRELAYGWPETVDFSAGPSLVVEWQSEVDVEGVIDELTHTSLDRSYLARHSGVGWLADTDPNPAVLRTRMELRFSETDSGVRMQMASLRSRRITARGGEVENPPVDVERQADNGYGWSWNGDSVQKLKMGLDRFLPVLDPGGDREDLGPRDRERTFYNAFQILYAAPLDDLERLILRFGYLSSIRDLPPSVYRPAAVPPEEVGVSGQYAAQMLHRRQSEGVHYLPPVQVPEGGGSPELATEVRAEPLLEAVNHVFRDLAVQAPPIDFEDFKELGFRLLFGNASLQHVGRGLGYLLPVVQLGLVADPIRFRDDGLAGGLDGYLEACGSPTQIAIEEPETHLHPKVQTRLADWFVALAMAGRRLLIETHSDHLVRRLRGLIARAAEGSELEQWLAENVVIAEIEQDDGGRSKVVTSRLTRDGGIEERWPADFMEEAPDEERAIYMAGLDKRASEVDYGPESVIVHTDDD